MGRIGRLLVIEQVARLAFCGEAKVLADGRALVAVLARYRGMGAQEREAIDVILELLRFDVPAVYGVALLAIGSELAAVDIRVTISAVLADIGEDGVDVAFAAFHFLVHAAQGVMGLVVIEFDDRANGPPTRGGVAILARDVQIAMGAARCLFLRNCSGSSVRRRRYSCT